ncbi:MAG: Zn-ribbon domain-containing OB-fold protein [Conexivisphaerales archaeon]
MPLPEKINTASALRSWTDKLPLHYIYTAGVAGEKFFSGLKQGKLIASRCSGCGTKYLPPKAYCTKCYKHVDEYHEVKVEGRVRSVAKDPNENKVYCFISFDGYQGGILHLASPDIAIGDKVVPRYKPVRDRKGRITDISFFEKVA